MTARTLRNVNLVLLAGIEELSRESTAFPFLTCALLGLVFIRTRVREYLLAVSALALVFLPRWQLSVRWGLFDNLLGTYAPVWVYAGLTLGLIAFVTVFWRRLFHPLGWIAASSAAVIAVFRWAPGGAAEAAAALWSRTFLPVLYFRQNNAEARLRPWDALWTAPFWQFDLPTWDPHVLRNQEAAAGVQREALRRILRLWAVFALLLLAETLLFDPRFGALPIFTRVGFHVALDPAMPLTWTWVNVLFNAGQFVLLRLWIRISVITLFLNVAGYPMLEGFQQPWRAKSFSDFFSRILSYYSRVATVLVYIPVYRRLRGLRRFRPFDQLLSLALAVFIFSMLYHCSRDYWIFRVPSEGPWIYARSMALYSAVIAALITLSFVVERPERWRETPAWLRVPLYIVLYALLFTMSRFAVEPWSITADLLKTLLGWG